MTYAQIEHIGRFETPFSWNIKSFNVIPNGAEGCLILTEEKEEEGKVNNVRFTHLNDRFEQVWTDVFDLTKNMHVEAFDYFKGKNYILFNNGSDSGDFKLFVVDSKTNEVGTYDQKLLRDFKPTDFVALENSVVIGGKIDNKPTVFLYDVASKRLNTLKNIYQIKGEIFELKRNEDLVSFNVLVSQMDDKKDQTVLVNTYDHHGNFLRKYELETDPFYQLTNGVSSSIYDVEQVVVGLYNYKKNTDPSGYYINHVDKQGNQTMKYLPFGAFVSFFSHEGEKRAKSLKEKSLARFNDQTPFRYNVEAILNSMLEKEDKFIINTQFFKPLNYLKQNSVMAKNGEDTPRSTLNTRDLQSIRYLPRSLDFTHSFTFGVDTKGNLLWDVNTEINTSQTGGLSAFGEFSDDMSNLLFSHYYNEELYVHDLRTSKTYYNMKLPLLDEGDELDYESPSFGGIKSWQNNRYLIYGIHHIGEKESTLEPRKVYFVNGLGFKAQ